MYQSMYETETYHWYFKAKYEIVLNLLKKYGLGKNTQLNIIDFGCGCGKMLQYLSQYGNAEGIDFSDEAILYCKQSFDGAIEKADLEIRECGVQIHSIGTRAGTVLKAPQLVFASTVFHFEAISTVHLI